jgi:serine/threonine protein kinase
VTQTADPRLGSTIGGYRIDSLIGRGGMGVVYLAEDIRLERRVALKILAPELADRTGFRERFIRESRLAASIDHPNVLPIYDAGEEGGVLYIAMRYVDGTDLRRLVEAEGRLDPASAVAVVSQVAAALDAAHARGLVHRDVKPGNVLLSRSERSSMGDHVYLSDFGLTKRTSSDSGVTATGQFVGTMDYAAPEQFEGGTVDGRTDQYSLGCVLFECLTGSVPFPRDGDAAVMFAHLMAEVPSVRDSRPDLPNGLDEAVRRAMAKDPKDRFPSAGAFAAAAAESVVAPSASPAATQPGLRRARPWLVAAVAGVAVVGLVAALLTRGSTPSSSPSPSRGAGPAPAGRAIKIDPLTGDVSASAALAQGPLDVAVGEGSVWVTNPAAGSVSRLDSGSGALVAQIPVSRSPTAVAVGEGAVWVTHPTEGTVSRIDPLAGAVTAEIPVGVGIGPIAAGGGSVWVASVKEHIVSRIDPERNAVVETTPIEWQPQPVGDIEISDIAVDGPDALVASFEALGLVSEIDRVDASGTLTSIGRSEWRVPPGPHLAAGSGTAWMTLTMPRFVRSMDLATGSLGPVIRVGGSPVDITIDATGYIWVLNQGDGTVWKLSSDGRTLDVINVGTKAMAIGAGDGAVWVTLQTAE